ncbi:hypothetical protein GPALN_004565 [Globodera pallida]|nr:hypothetical protein GPALN_004565 [Globodera pallida]
MFLKTFELNAHNLADTDAIILDLGSDDGLKVIIDYEISKNVVDQTTYHGVLLYCYKLLPGPEMSKKALVVFANSLTEYGSIGHSGDTVTTLSVGNIEEAEYCPNGAFMDISTSDTNNGGINLDYVMSLRIFALDLLASGETDSSADWCNRKHKQNIIFALHSYRRTLQRQSQSSGGRPIIRMSLFQEIKGRQEEFMRAFNAGNAKGAAEIYDPDGFFMPNGHSPVKGRSGIEKFFQKDMADGVTSAQIITEEVNGSGDWAFERGSYHLECARGTESGAYLQVWKKINGAWLIHNDCFNVIQSARQS